MRRVFFASAIAVSLAAAPTAKSSKTVEDIAIEAKIEYERAQATMENSIEAFWRTLKSTDIQDVKTVLAIILGFFVFRWIIHSFELRRKIQTALKKPDK